MYSVWQNLAEPADVHQRMYGGGEGGKCPVYIDSKMVAMLGEYGGEEKKSAFSHVYSASSARKIFRAASAIHLPTFARRTGRHSLGDFD